MATAAGGRTSHLSPPRASSTMPAVAAPLVLCIDVEPDERVGRPTSLREWQGFDLLFAMLARWRIAFAERSGTSARLSWFVRLDPQVASTYGTPTWPLRTYERHFDEAARCGDTIGLHTHAFRWLEAERCWTIDHADQAWIEECLETSFDAYRRHFGSTCHSFRFGDRFMNTDTMNALERLGVRSDLTPEPLQKACRSMLPDEPATGMIPSYERLHHAPYVPDREDFLAKSSAERSITVLPVSSGRVWIDRPAPPLLASLRRNLGRVIYGPPAASEWVETLNLARPHERVVAITEHILRTLENPYLAVVVRSGAASIARKQREVERSLDYLLQLAADKRVVMMTPESAISQLMGARPASPLSNSTSSPRSQ